MEADVQVLIDEGFPLQRICLKEDPAKIEGAGLIAEAGSIAETINDRTTIEGNILRFNSSNIFNRPIQSRAGQRRCFFPFAQ